MTLPIRMASLPRRRLQSSLLITAAAFVLFFAAGLTLSPAARAHQWDAGFRWMHWLGVLVWLTGFAFASRTLSRARPAIDPLLLPLVALLSGWGLMTIFRLSTTFGLRQSLWLAVGLAFFSFGLTRPQFLEYLRRYKYLWLSLGLILTTLTLFLGVNPLGLGARLWLGCCGVYLQPSEPLKLLFIIYLAAYLADRQPFTPGLAPLIIPTLIVTAIALTLLVSQQDLGTASMFVLIYTAILFVATGRFRILFFSFLGLGLAGVLGYFLFDVVAIRVEAWFNPWLDPSGRSYQIVQSLMAIAAGGLLGRGPGMGSPSVVPIAHSDFIFSAVAEETGLVGVIGLFSVLALFAIRGLRLSLQTDNLYHRYLAVGISAYFATQSLLIIGGNIRLLPLTGVTLPFLSYGGSSLVTSFLAILILSLIEYRAPTAHHLNVEARPTHWLAGLLLAGFAAAAITVGWWGFWRGPELLTRTDNIRRAIAERYVPRGQILDRNGNLLHATVGTSGSYQRLSLLENSGAVFGYSDPVYGQAGIEAALDTFLRGQANYPAMVIWQHHLLYGQPPPGLDIRLTIQSELQQAAQTALDNETGAIIILNPATGELLALASSPSFDSNEIASQADTLNKDPRSPLFNRATAGLYQPGPTLGPLLYAAVLDSGNIPAEPSQLGFEIGDNTFDCARSPGNLQDWAAVLQGGCPGPVAGLGLQLEGSRLLNLFHLLGLYQRPNIELPAASLAPPSLISAPAAAAIGQGTLRVSPLQLALALSVLSNQGVTPPPLLINAIESPAGEWELTPATVANAPVFTIASIQAVSHLLATPAGSWEISARALNQPEDSITWYVTGSTGGTSPRLVLVLLESDQPALARAFGRALWNASVSSP